MRRRELELDDDELDGLPDDGPEDRRRSGWRRASGWIVVAALVALTVRTFLVQPFSIPSASMEPALREGNRILVNKTADDVHDLHRGDVIVFERPDAPRAADHPDDEVAELVERVVGLPGDVVEARGGAVHVNGERLDEPYLAPGTATDHLGRQDVPEGTVFVLGDNRTGSHDSRDFGPVDEGAIVGRAFARFLPLDGIGSL